MTLLSYGKKKFGTPPRWVVTYNKSLHGGMARMLHRPAIAVGHRPLLLSLDGCA